MAQSSLFVRNSRNFQASRRFLGTSHQSKARFATVKIHDVKFRLVP